jgi:hypothetical protein
VEIVPGEGRDRPFLGDDVSSSGESQRLAEVIQAGCGLGATTQTLCRQEHLIRNKNSCALFFGFLPANDQWVPHGAPIGHWHEEIPKQIPFHFPVGRQRRWMTEKKQIVD